jgi:hypothetical protein
MATDACDGEVPVICSTDGEVAGANCTYSQVFTYSATDECGNTSAANVTYTWKVDETPPVLPTLPGGGDLGCNPTPPSCVNDLMATDACDGEVPVICSTDGEVAGANCTYSQVFTYSATDECGNTSAANVTYTWKVDETPPVITCPPDYTSTSPDCPPGPEISGNATATDNCDLEVEIRYSDAPGDNCTIIRTWTATDECGNTVSCNQTIYCPCEDDTACAAQTAPHETEFGGSANNWFTYITYNKGSGNLTDPMLYPIYAGQTHRCGTLYVYDEGGILYVNYSLTIEGPFPADDGYTWLGISEYHLEVEDEFTGPGKDDGFNDIRTYKKKDDVYGNARPGQCEYKDKYSPWVSETGYIPTEDISGYDSPIYIFAHSVMWWVYSP